MAAPVDPLTARIRARVDPLGSAEDFRDYEKQKTKYIGGQVQDIGRAWNHLPPLSDGMSEIDRNRLIRDYTEMLGNLTKLDTQLKSEAAKTGRNRQTMWTNTLGQLLKYDATNRATRGGVIEAQASAATKRLDALTTAAKLEGTATLSNDILEKHSRAFYDLSLQVQGGKIIDNAEYEKQLTAILKNTSDDRMITGIVEKLADISGVNVKDYIGRMHTLFPPSHAMYGMLTDRFRAGNIAYKAAEKKQEKITADTIKAMRAFDESTAEVTPWVAGVAKLAVLGASGMVVDDKLAQAMGISPEGYEKLQSGAGNLVIGKDGKPILESSKTETKVQSDPYIEDTRDRIINEIDKLVAGDSPRHVQTKREMLASNAFATFKKRYGITNDDIAFEYWAKAAKKNAQTGRRADRATMEDAMLQEDWGKVLDNFDSIPDMVERRAPTMLPDAAALPTPDGTAPTPAPVAVKPTTPAVTPPPSGSSSSAPVVSGAKASPPTTEVAGDAKPVVEKSDESRIVNDPRNPDVIYRQYADGRLEQVSTSKDKTVSYKNPKRMAGPAKAKAEEILGTYQKEQTFAERQQDDVAQKQVSLDLEDIQPSFHRPKEAKKEGEYKNPSFIGKEKKLLQSEMPIFGAGGPELGLDIHKGTLFSDPPKSVPLKDIERSPIDDDVSMAESGKKGEIDNTDLSKQAQERLRLMIRQSLAQPDNNTSAGE